jgi:hypothetical protein
MGRTTTERRTADLYRDKAMRQSDGRAPSRPRDLRPTLPDVPKILQRNVYD